MNQKPFIKNASDEEQIKSAEHKVRSKRDRELSDVAYVLSSKQGRRFLWRLLGQCRVFETIWEPSAKIHYNSGQQDIGHFVQAEIVEANPKAFLEMMTENSKGELDV